nr:MAG TPA: Histone acetyltransferase subunit NuA4 [Caudoviricetes sp.]
MAKHNAKALLKRKQEIVNRIQKLQREIAILEREHREIINNLDLNKGNNDGQTEESESSL